MFLLDLQNMLWQVNDGNHPDLVEMEFMMDKWVEDGAT